MKFMFHGVRGSIPSPSTTQKTTIKYGGNTTCVSIEFPNHSLLVDTGTGITNFASKSKAKNFLILFSHFHHDHVQGFPFFFPVYDPNSILHLFYPRLMKKDVATILKEQFNPPLFPYQFEYTFSKKFYRQVSATHSIRLLNIKTTAQFKEVFDPHEHNPASLDSLMEQFPKGYNAYVYCPKDEEAVPYEVARVDFAESRAHPNDGSYFFSFTQNGKRIVFATDIEQRIQGYEVLYRITKDADILIHDAQYLPEDYYKYQDFGHSTYEMACDFAHRCNVGELILTHWDPWHDDKQVDRIIERANEYMKKIGADSIPVTGAHEGRVLDLSNTSNEG